MATKPMDKQLFARLQTACQRDIDEMSEQRLKRWREECLQPTAVGFHRFCELVVRDDTGQRLQQAAVHRSWESHAQWCRARGVTPVTLAPWGHGKSVQRIGARAAWLLAQDVDLRILLVTNSEDNAKGRVGLVQQILESNMYQYLFPQVRIGRSNLTEVWLRRRGSAADPALRAVTYSSIGTGPRCDVLFVDDVVDYRNSVEIPAERGKVSEVIQGKWLNRLVPPRPDGQRHWIGYHEEIGTRWHSEDWWAEVLRLPGYCVLVQAVSTDNARIDCVVCGDHDVIAAYPTTDELVREDFLPASCLSVTSAEESTAIPGYESGRPIGSIDLWTAGGYGKERLDLLEQESPRWHACGRRQKPFSEGELVFPHFRECIVDQAPLLVAPQGFMVAVGVDLASKKRRGNAIVVLAGDGHRTVPQDVLIGQWSSPEVSKTLSLIFERWNPAVIVVEDNAYQASLIEWGRAASAQWTSRVKSFTTTVQNKYDFETGVASLDIEFNNRCWAVPEDAWQGHPPGCSCSWCVWQRAFMTCTQYDLRSRTSQIDLM